MDTKVIHQIAIGLHLSILSKSYCYIYVISSSSSITVTIFSLHDLSGIWNVYQRQDSCHTTLLTFKLSFVISKYSRLFLQSTPKSYIKQLLVYMSAFPVMLIAISMSFPPVIVLLLPFSLFMIYLEYDTGINPKIVVMQLLYFLNLNMLLS